MKQQRKARKTYHFYFKKQNTYMTKMSQNNSKRLNFPSTTHSVTTSNQKAYKPMRSSPNLLTTMAQTSKQKYILTFLKKYKY